MLIPTLKEYSQLKGEYLRFLFSRPYVTLTDVPPEEGRNAVAAALLVVPSDVNYGLELIVERANLVQVFDFLPRAHHIISEQPVPAKVVSIRNMGEIPRTEITRYLGFNGFPYSFSRPVMAYR